MHEKLINVAKDFSRFPAGRFTGDGPNSGQRFREEMLVKLLRENYSMTVNLDGAAGYGSSFLEEAFGGLVRLHGFSGTFLREHLTIESEDSSLAAEIWSYIDDASNAPKR